MKSVLTRKKKGHPLSWEELDKNFELCENLKGVTQPDPTIGQDGDYYTLYEHLDMTNEDSIKLILDYSESDNQWVYSKDQLGSLISSSTNPIIYFSLDAAGIKLKFLNNDSVFDKYFELFNNSKYYKLEQHNDLVNYSTDIFTIQDTTILNDALKLLSVGESIIANLYSAVVIPHKDFIKVQGIWKEFNILDLVKDPTTGLNNLQQEVITVVGTSTSSSTSTTPVVIGNSHIEGNLNVASGDYSHAEGQSNIASGNYSHTEGQSNVASGYCSHIEGIQSKASGNYSHAEGYGVDSSGNYSHAEGYGTKSVGEYSHAEGFRVESSGNYSHAEGYMNIASGDYSHAEGNNTKASKSYSHTEGNGTVASGNYSHTEGYMTTASGDYSHVEGNHSTASGDYSHAEGENNIASGKYSHAEGENTKASNDHSHAEGQETESSGVNSHAEGNMTIARGGYSHSEGYSTIAEGTNSHSEGNGTKAIGVSAHSEGQSTIASGDYSHTEGYQSTAVGENSHAEGWGCLATAKNSHAEGKGTIALNDSSHAGGEFNIGVSNTSLVEIGNGNVSARSNAFEIHKTGEIIAASLTTDLIIHDKCLVTKEYVKLVKDFSVVNNLPSASLLYFEKTVYNIADNLKYSCVATTPNPLVNEDCYWIQG